MRMNVLKLLVFIMVIVSLFSLWNNMSGRSHPERHGFLLFSFFSVSSLPLRWKDNIYYLHDKIEIMKFLFIMESTFYYKIYYYEISMCMFWSLGETLCGYLVWDLWSQRGALAVIGMCIFNRWIHQHQNCTGCPG